MSRQRSMEVIKNSEYVTIGELVRLTDVRYSTLKFYTEEGMLPFEQAEENLTRKAYQSQRQEPCVPLLRGYAPAPVRGSSFSTEHGTVHAYRLGAFQPA